MAEPHRAMLSSKWLSLLFLVAVFFSLAACSFGGSKKSAASTGALALDPVTVTGVQTSPDARWGMPATRVVALKTCARQAATGLPVVSETFTILGHRITHRVASDVAGCLHWSERVEFNFFAPEHYVSLPLKFQSQFGEETVMVALSPWRQEADQLWIDLRTRSSVAFSVVPANEADKALRGVPPFQREAGMYPGGSNLSLQKVHFSVQEATGVRFSVQAIGIWKRLIEKLGAPEPLQAGNLAVSFEFFSLGADKSTTSLGKSAPVPARVEGGQLFPDAIALAAVKVPSAMTRTRQFVRIEVTAENSEILPYLGWVELVGGQSNQDPVFLTPGTSEPVKSAVVAAGDGSYEYDSLSAIPHPTKDVALDPNTRKVDFVVDMALHLKYVNRARGVSENLQPGDVVFLAIGKDANGVPKLREEKVGADGFLRWTETMEPFVWDAPHQRLPRFLFFRHARSEAVGRIDVVFCPWLSKNKEYFFVDLTRRGGVLQEPPLTENVTKVQLGPAKPTLTLASIEKRRINAYLRQRVEREYSLTLTPKLVRSWVATGDKSPQGLQDSLVPGTQYRVNALVFGRSFEALLAQLAPSVEEKAEKPEKTEKKEKPIDSSWMERHLVGGSQVNVDADANGQLQIPVKLSVPWEFNEVLSGQMHVLLTIETLGAGPLPEKDVQLLSFNPLVADAKQSEDLGFLNLALPKERVAELLKAANPHFQSDGMVRPHISSAKLGFVLDRAEQRARSTSALDLFQIHLRSVGRPAQVFWLDGDRAATAEALQKMGAPTDLTRPQLEKVYALLSSKMVMEATGVEIEKNLGSLHSLCAAAWSEKYREACMLSGWEHLAVSTLVFVDKMQRETIDSSECRESRPERALQMTVAREVTHSERFIKGLKAAENTRFNLMARGGASLFGFYGVQAETGYQREKEQYKTHETVLHHDFRKRADFFQRLTLSTRITTCPLQASTIRCLSVAARGVNAISNGSQSLLLCVHHVPQTLSESWYTLSENTPRQAGEDTKDLFTLGWRKRLRGKEAFERFSEKVEDVDRAHWLEALPNDALKPDQILGDEGLRTADAKEWIFQDGGAFPGVWRMSEVGAAGRRSLWDESEVRLTVNQFTDAAMDKMQRAGKSPRREVQELRWRCILEHLSLIIPFADFKKDPGVALDRMGVHGVTRSADKPEAPGTCEVLAKELAEIR